MLLQLQRLSIHAARAALRSRCALMTAPPTLPVQIFAPRHSDIDPQENFTYPKEESDGALPLGVELDPARSAQRARQHASALAGTA